jgi:ferric-dicitrate binding protein FerR (iron transport regulator)
MTPLAGVTRRLEELTAPREATVRRRIRGRVRTQAIRWLNEMETTDCPDEVWPVFEAWLRERPEHLQVYLAAERTRRVVDDLAGWCPKEGSEAAQRLLRLVADGERHLPGGATLAKWIGISLSVAVSFTLAALLMA